MLNSRSEKWYLAVIDDPEFLPGRSFKKLLMLLQQKFGFRYIASLEFNGKGKNWLFSDVIQLIEEGKIFTFEEMYSILDDVVQFDWVDFFLFIEYPINWNITDDDKYPDIVSKTDTFIRGVDDQYMYIYTPRMDIVDVITDNYLIEPLIYKELDQHVYPF